MIGEAPAGVQRRVSAVRPALGIMAQVRTRDGRLSGKQGPALLRYLQIANEYGAFACVFDPRQVVTGRDQMAAFVLSSRGRGSSDWGEVQQTEVFIPPVIYDQILSRTYENNPLVQAARQYLKTRAVMYNDGYFDKWQVHRWLQADPKTAAHLPHTALIEGRRDLVSFLRRYTQVFVKPVHGSLGRGILKAVRQPDGWHTTLRTKRGNNPEVVIVHPQGVFQRYHRRLRSRPHIAQEGLALLMIEGRPVDVRVLMQKDQTGRWRRTKVYLRVAADGEFVSNLTSGGLALPLTELPLSAHQPGLSALRRAIRNLSEDIPSVIERESDMALAELGIDLGIDADGKVFVIEVNAKPWKVAETVAGSAQLVKLALERPIRFGLRLATQVSARKETQL